MYLVESTTLGGGRRCVDGTRFGRQRVERLAGARGRRPGVALACQLIHDPEVAGELPAVGRLDLDPPEAWIELGDGDTDGAGVADRLIRIQIERGAPRGSPLALLPAAELRGPFDVLTVRTSDTFRRTRHDKIRRPLTPSAGTMSSSPPAGPIAATSRLRYESSHGTAKTGSSGSSTATTWKTAIACLLPPPRTSRYQPVSSIGRVSHSGSPAPPGGAEYWMSGRARFGFSGPATPPPDSHHVLDSTTSATSSHAAPSHRSNAPSAP